MESRIATPEERTENLAALEEIKRLFSTIEDQEIGEFLINATAYPFDSLIGCMPKIRELAEKSNGDWRKAIDVSYEEIDSEMTRINSLTEEQDKL